MVVSRWVRIVSLGVLVGAVSLLTLQFAPVQAAGSIGSCPMFPADNAWNQDVSAWPVHPNSANYINSIGASTNLHPDFGSDPTYGIPYIVVPSTQANVPITYDAYGDESDPGPFPIPLNAPVEAGGDGHVLVAQNGTCTLYELYQARQIGSGWTASSGAKWNLNSNALRPLGWTSADAAGLPILPGLVRYDEVTAGVIAHALRFTVAHSQAAYVYPATHFASSDTNPNLPPMGLRVRLKASYNISAFTGESRVIAEALRKYGMIVADNGSNWYISGSTDTRWNDDDLNQLKTVPGSAFEVVQPPSGPTNTPLPTLTRPPATNTPTRTPSPMPTFTSTSRPTATFQPPTNTTVPPSATLRPTSTNTIVPTSTTVPPSATLRPTSTNTAAPTKTVAPTNTTAPTSTTVPTGTGLRGDYFNNMNFTLLTKTRIDPGIDYNWGAGSPDPSIAADTFSIRWNGQVQPAYSQNYTFYVYADDSVRLWVNGTLIINSWTTGSSERAGAITLVGGSRYDIVLEYGENTGNARVTLSWSSASQPKQVIPAQRLYPPNS